jgi:hypothetical protein
VADGRDRGREGAVVDVRPPNLDSSFDGRLAGCALGLGDWSRSAMSDEGRLSQGPQIKED